MKDCNNWRGITLLSVPGKIFTKILMNRIKDEIDQKLRKEQAGFRAGRSCTDQIFILRNIIEQSNEWKRILYINFVDFEKAFDNLHQGNLWKILRIYRIPEKIIKLIRMFYSSYKCRIKVAEEMIRVSHS